MAQRIKGQEISIVVVAGGEVVNTMTAIQNFNINAKFELIEQGYLGETTQRYDEIFNGCAFDFELHIEEQNLLLFQKQVEGRARRTTPDIEFNIVATMLFPNGDTPIVTLPNVNFGEIPKGVGSRKDYVKVKIQGACSEEDHQMS